MKFFVDTANLDEIRLANSWGILDGVTTNPTLIAREGVSHKKRVLEICDLVGPGKAVSAECIETEYEKMLAEAAEIATWHENIHVKVPMTVPAMRVVRKLQPEGVRFNVTLIFSLPQALIACKAGGKFISFFVGRVDDTGSGELMKSIAEAVQMTKEYNFPQGPEILVASIRSPYHIVEGIKAGAHISTVPYKVLEELAKHPLTDIGIEKFLADAKKTASLQA